MINYFNNFFFNNYTYNIILYSCIIKKKTNLRLSINNNRTLTNCTVNIRRLQLITIHLDLV